MKDFSSFHENFQSVHFSNESTAIHDVITDARYNKMYDVMGPMSKHTSADMTFMNAQNDVTLCVITETTTRVAHFIARVVSDLKIPITVANVVTHSFTSTGKSSTLRASAVVGIKREINALGDRTVAALA